MECGISSLQKTRKIGTSMTSKVKYDPFGRRIEKKITENGSTATTKYIYDNEDIILRIR